MGRTKLLLLAMAVLALAPGCIIETNDGDVVTDGVFHATWSLSDANGPTTCQQQAADKVSFLFTARYDGMGYDELFACPALAGDTVPLPLDDYTYVASILDCPDATPGCPGGDILGESPPLRDTFATCSAIDYGICFVDLPTIEFAF